MNGVRFADVIVQLGRPHVDLILRTAADILRFWFVNNSGMSARHSWCSILRLPKVPSVAASVRVPGCRFAAQVHAVLDDDVRPETTTAANGAARALARAGDCSLHVVNTKSLRARRVDFYNWAASEVRPVIHWASPPQDVAALGAVIAAL
jgi:hypothetical protein